MSLKRLNCPSSIPRSQAGFRATLPYTDFGGEIAQSSVRVQALESECWEALVSWADLGHVTSALCLFSLYVKVVNNNSTLLTGLNEGTEVK